MKRLSAPKTWPIRKKEYTFVRRPKPGPHSFEHGISLDSLLKYVMNAASTTREVKFILNTKQVLVNGKRRKDPRFLVGLFDVISFPEIKENYRVLIDRKKRLVAVPISEKEATLKPSRIVGKTVLPKKRIQINLGDGRNLALEKNSYKVGDTLVFDFGKKGVADHIPLEQKTIVYLISGKHTGIVGRVEDVKSNKIIISTSEKDVFETRKEFAFPIGKDKPSITLIEEFKDSGKSKK